DSPGSSGSVLSGRPPWRKLSCLPQSTDSHLRRSLNRSILSSRVGNYHREGGNAMTDTNRPGTQPTVLTDVDIPFGRLVAIFIKSGLPAIPATIIIWLILAAILMILGSVFHFPFFRMMWEQRQAI